jgi:hypothetical protein
MTGPIPKDPSDGPAPVPVLSVLRARVTSWWPRVVAWLWRVVA